MSLQHPEDVLRHALSTFSEATKGLVEIRIVPFTHNNNFYIACNLNSSYIKDYKVDVIWINHPVSMYPLRVDVRNEKIKKSLNCNGYKCNNKQDFCDSLDKVFLSEAFTEEVKSLVALASINKGRS